MDDIKIYTHPDWLAEAERRFGADSMKWRFVCPSCGHVASVQDWKDAGARKGEVAFSCVGRALGTPEGDARAFRNAGGPCNYTSGGLFCVNNVQVITDDGRTIPVFDFDDATEVHDASH